MFSFFTKPLKQIGKKVNADLARFIDYQTRSIEKIIKYEMSHGNIVDSAHPLIRLVYALPRMGDEGNLLKYYVEIKGMENELATSIGVFTSLNEGKVLRNVFYSGQVALVIDRSTISPRDILSRFGGNWRELQPVKVLKLNSEHNPLSTAKVSDGVPNEDYSIISIDIGMFSLMMALWLEENKENEVSETPQIFVSRYVIPNMLYSQHTAALVTDLLYGLNGFNISRSDVDSSQWVLDKHSEFVKLVLEVLEESQYSSLSVEEILELIPTYNGVLLEHLPDLSDRETLTNSGILIASSIEWLLLSSTLVSRSDGGQGEFRNRFKALDRKLRNNGAVRRLDDPVMRVTVSDGLDQIKDSL